MFDYGVCFGGMLRGYASGYASRSVKTKVVAFPEGMLQGMLRGYASGYASPKSNIPVLHRLDTLKKDKPMCQRNGGRRVQEKETTGRQLPQPGAGRAEVSRTWRSLVVSSDGPGSSKNK